MFKFIKNFIFKSNLFFLESIIKTGNECDVKTFEITGKNGLKVEYK